MRQHFYTYPIVVELRGERPDPRSPQAADPYQQSAPQSVAAVPQPRVAPLESPVR
jgi:hypothetical protein